MELGEATYRGISNRSPHTEGGPVRSVVAEVRSFFGLRPPEGISERTWRKARNDPTWNPSTRVRAILEAAQRRSRLSIGREKWLRSPGAVGIHADTQVSKDRRVRKILVSTWPSWQASYPGLMVDRFLTRQDETMGDPILWTLTADVPEMELLDVFEVRFFQTRGEADRWVRR